MQLKNIAFNSAYLLNHAVPLLDVQYVRERYHTLLAQYRYLSVTGHVRSCQFIQDLQNYYPDALLALLHCEVDRPRRTHSTWPIKVVRAKESHHPLFHILTLPLLKSSAHLFFQESLNDHHPGPWRQGLWPCLNPICPHYQHLHIHACYIQRKADRTYHGTFACDCGFEYSRIISEAAPDNIYRYDKILAYGQLWEKTLSALWQDTHLTRAQIARCLGVSADTIRQKVKTLGLPLRRKAMEGESMPPAEAEFALHREQWLKTLAAFPGQGVEVLIWQAADTYDWLWKYDRAWLKAHVPPRIDPQRRRTPWQGRGEPYTTGREGRILPQEWERRDRMVADEIRKRARELLEAPGASQRVTIGKLRQDLPAFARWAQPVTQLAHFPLTKRAFDEVLESSEHFAFRRVQWVAQQCIAERKPLKQWQLVYTAGVKGNQHKPVVQEAIQAAMCQFASLE